MFRFEENNFFFRFKENAFVFPFLFSATQLIDCFLFSVNESSFEIRAYFVLEQP